MTLSKCINHIKISLKSWPKPTEIYHRVYNLAICLREGRISFLFFFSPLFSVQSEEHWLGQESLEKFFTNQYRALVGTSSIIFKSVPTWWCFTTSLFPWSYMSKCPVDYRVRCQMLNIKNNILLKLVLDHFQGV